VGWERADSPRVVEPPRSLPDGRSSAPAETWVTPAVGENFDPAPLDMAPLTVGNRGAARPGIFFLERRIPAASPSGVGSLRRAPALDWPAEPEVRVSIPV